MRAVLQRVLEASVTIEDEVVSEIGPGIMMLFAAGENDQASDTEALKKFWQKIARLRVFEDAAGKTNLDIAQSGGEFLIVPQFTLYANLRRGNRPSFQAAASPEVGETLFEALKPLAESTFPGRVQYGVFGADMKVSLINDGPFTLLLDSEELEGPRR